jgi:hypothetical protein
MPVEFLTDDEAAAYGLYAGTPSRADLDRVFFLDDDLELVGKHRGEHMRAGFALQLVTVRWLGTFLEDPLDVPGGVLDFVAGQQLGMADPSKVKRYTEWEHTRFDHQWEIKKDRGLPGVRRRRGGVHAVGGRPGHGRPGTARRRSSPTGWRGCGSGTSCCPA